MSNTIPHHWLYPESLQEAAETQRMLAQRVSQEDDPSPVNLLGGVDVSNNLRDPNKMVYAAVVTLDPVRLAVTQTSSIALACDFPYMSGFLAFRESPSVIQAYEQLPQKPDLILVDGHGISHPRGLGIASHLGVLLDCRTIGVAKSILVGKPEGELGPEPGDYIPLVWKGRQIGVVLRTKLRTNPVYISVGNKISLHSAIDWVMKSVRGYRLPEPTRQAHNAANDRRRSLVPDRETIIQLKLQ